MKLHEECFSFANPYTTVGHSNSGRETGKIQHKNFCTKFHTEVAPEGCGCWHHKTFDEIAGGRDE